MKYDINTYKLLHILITFIICTIVLIPTGFVFKLYCICFIEFELYDLNNRGQCKLHTK